MATFVLADHSLAQVGGHHFDYARQILAAADEAGFRIVLATHRRFRCRGLFPAHWRIVPCFQQATYDNPALPEDVCAAAGLPALLHHWRAVRARGRLQRTIQRFADCCRNLFQQVPVQAGDHVLWPTMSEVDFLGLAEYLCHAPESRAADWHLQFHFKIFDGREPDYPHQTARRERLRQQFLRARELTRQHRLLCYTITPQLQAQYQALEVGPFHLLPYPIDPAFRPSQDRVAVAQAWRSPGAAREKLRAMPTALRGHAVPANMPTQSRGHGTPDPDLTDSAPATQGRQEGLPHAPLKVICAGPFRRGPSRNLLGRLLDEFWEDFFAPGKMQLMIKSNKWWYRLPLPRRSLFRDKTAPVVYLKSPLSPEAYGRWIREADIGLFLYDQQRYYAQLSGVLGEFLAAGVPVLVPAGCWLAEQIAESIYAYQEQLSDRLGVIDILSGSRIAWQAGGGNSDAVAFGGTQAAAVAQLTVPDGAAEALCTWRWAQPTTAGTYVRLCCEQWDAAGNLLDQFSAVVGHRAGAKAVPALVHVQPGARQLRLTWANAFHDGPIALGEVRLTFLRAAAGQGRNVPQGAVGLIAADLQQVPRLLRDLAEHYPHYRATAEACAASRGEAHHPRRTLEQLLSRQDVPGPAREVCKPCLS